MLSNAKGPGAESVQGMAKSLSRKLSQNSEDEHFLFEAPSDLVCPITHELFKDPVINAVGQVYEREAILSHLRRRATDPVSMVQLTNLDLTPVFPMRSRALEYRERVAKQSVEIASRLACKDPVKYLRRASEMCCGVDVRVPGLSPEVIQYIQSHTSNVYDTTALELFADGLQKSGYIDQAANVYCSLLTRGEDRNQQAEVLKKCFRCWAAEESDSPDVAAVSKLAHFIETQEAVTAAHILELMVAADIGTGYILKTCEFLLSKWSGREIDKLQVKYVQLHMQSVEERVTALHQQLDNLRMQKPEPSPPLANEGSKGARMTEERKKQRRLIASLVFAVASIAGKNNLFSRIAQLVPLFYLLGAP